MINTKMLNFGTYVAQRLKVNQDKCAWTMPCQNLTSLSTVPSFQPFPALNTKTDPIIDTLVDANTGCLIWQVWVKGVNDCQQPIYERHDDCLFKRHPTSTKERLGGHSWNEPDVDAKSFKTHFRHRYPASRRLHRVIKYDGQMYGRA